MIIGREKLTNPFNYNTKILHALVDIITMF